MVKLDTRTPNKRTARVVFTVCAGVVLATTSVCAVLAVALVCVVLATALVCVVLATPSVCVVLADASVCAVLLATGFVWGGFDGLHDSSGAPRGVPHEDGGLFVQVEMRGLCLCGLEGGSNSLSSSHVHTLKIRALLLSSTCESGSDLARVITSNESNFTFNVIVLPFLKKVIKIYNSYQKSRF